MKILKFYFCIISFIMITNTAFATNIAMVEGEYKAAMEKTLAQLDTVKSAKELLLCRNAFERISTKYPEEWLSLYYVAYTNIEAVYYDKSAKNNSLILQNTETILDKLNNFASGDKSEMNTLWGYYYMAKIMLDPQAYGPKYSGDVIRYFKKAKEQNADNPRPIFLLAFFDQMLPSFMKLNMDFCEEMAKAGKAYDKQEVEWNKPSWGKPFFEKVSEKCNK